MSATRGLPTDATLRSIIDLLGNAEDYVRQAFGNLHSVQRSSKANVQLRIGITGTGDVLNYRVEVIDDVGAVVGHPQTYRGDNHRALFEDNSDLHALRWSTATSTYDDVRGLLGELRSFRR